MSEPFENRGNEEVFGFGTGVKYFTSSSKRRICELFRATPGSTAGDKVLENETKIICMIVDTGFRDDSV